MVVLFKTISGTLFTLPLGDGDVLVEPEDAAVERDVEPDVGESVGDDRGEVFAVELVDCTTVLVGSAVVRPLGLRNAMMATTSTTTPSTTIVAPAIRSRRCLRAC